MSSLRQKAISSNIANVNTPNYKVSRVEFERILGRAIDGVAVKKTHDNHIGIRDISDVKPLVYKSRSTSLKDNGNNVDIDVEMTELAANEIYYNTLIHSLNAKLGSLNYVINR